MNYLLSEDKLSLIKACPVDFCRKACKPIPEDAEILRASGFRRCDQCDKLLYDHEEFYYPTGMGHAVLGCDGIYYHL